MLHKIAREDKVLINDINFPLDTSCNNQIGTTLGGHENSCLYAKYVLAAKKQELESIDQETAKEMESLQAQSDAAAAKIDARLLAAYRRIRNNVRNGLAVVTVKRDACGGCFNHIPPQRQLDIRSNKKIIVCEYCGRILVSNLLDQQEKPEE